MGHLWIKAVSFINKNTWAGTETGKMGPIQGSTTPCNVEGTMTKGLSWQSSPSQCRETIKEWVPLLDFALLFQLGIEEVIFIP